MTTRAEVVAQADCLRRLADRLEQAEHVEEVAEVAEATEQVAVLIRAL